MSVKSILFVGVGGQGTILASKLMTVGLVQSGFDVKMSEIHGMSQRGGSVSTQVRYGDKVYSPVIEDGTADVIVAFEKMEAYRWISKLKKGGKLIINDLEIPTALILAGLCDYPVGIIEQMKVQALDVVLIDATKRAVELGNFKVMNTLLLGAVIKAIQLDDIDWQAIIRNHVKPQFVELNLLAYQLGYDQRQ